MIDFDNIWRRIEAHAGEEFRKIRGGRFRYEVVGGMVVLDRPSHRIHRGQFEQASALLPFTNTAPLQKFWGPSYLYAILMDDRIRQDDW